MSEPLQLSQMAVTERKKKKPPTFQYLPKNRAKRLKKSWVEDHKIRSKWKAQKRREGLTNKTDTPVEGPSLYAYDDVRTNADSNLEPGTSPDGLRESPIPTPSHDKTSLRNLRKFAYAPKPIMQKSDSSGPKASHESIRNKHGRKVTMRRETGQPNMKLRMNVLLETIKRDFS